MKQMDTRGLSFADMRKGDKYYVDKTMLIADILGTDDSGVYLFTRPRRFGKTTNLSMLDSFFNIKYKGNDWFDGLEISEHHEFDVYRNRFPVIHLDLKDLEASDRESFMNRMRAVIAGAYRDHIYLLDSGQLRDYECDDFRRILSRDVHDDYVRDCLPNLCRMLEEYHGQKVIVLIDECDRAVSDIFGTESFRPIIGALGPILSSLLKSNSSLQMAYVTGIMHIAKESIFSGLNNLWVDNVFSTMSDERFGFTESEVMDILSYYDRSDEFGIVKDWYDGYRFGDAEVYNPFSITYYIKKDEGPNVYWSNTAKDVVIDWLLDRIGMDTFSQILSLINGDSIDVKLNKTMTYDDLGHRIDSLYSMMVMSGYLKAVPKGDGVFEVSIPNKEVMSIVNGKVGGLSIIDNGIFQRFNTAVLDGDSDAIASILQSILKDASYLILKDEHDYQLVLMTIMHTLAQVYSVRTEYEAGNGRLDMILTPRREGMTPLIFELKRVRSEDELDGAVEGAVAQIHRQRYYMDMSGDVMLFGMAFWGKVPRVLVERITVRAGSPV